MVLDAAGLTTEQMQGFAQWTNLSETTFVLPPTDPRADYLVRIFTPGQELGFAGHPTLGTCHAWLEAGREPSAPGVIVQQCGLGLVEVRRSPAGLGFAAPPLLRSGPVDESLIEQVTAQLGIGRDDVVDAQWADNGPGWLAVLLRSADAVLGLRPAAIGRDIGVVGPYPPGSECAFEVRAFFLVRGSLVEDPVTGSLNAALGQWLLTSGRASSPYIASQGSVIGRAGRVHLSSDPDGTVWVSGATVTRISGEVDL